jgi:hypothetical protein
MDCGYGFKEANKDNKALLAIQANDLYNERNKSRESDENSRHTVVKRYVGKATFGYGRVRA